MPEAEVVLGRAGPRTRTCTSSVTLPRIPGGGDPMADLTTDQGQLDQDMLHILRDLITAEKIETTMYAQGLNSGVLSGLPPDNFAYVQSGVTQEFFHWQFLALLGADIPNNTFFFPPTAFTDPNVFLTTLLMLEETGIEAYSSAIRDACDPIGRPGLIIPLAQILSTEAEHRVLIRDVLGLVPANDLCVERVTTTDFGVFEARLAPFLSPNLFNGSSTPGFPFPDQATVLALANGHACVNPGVFIK